MLTRSAWQEVLVQAGFANELAWPAQESSPLRQHLLVARSPGVNRPDKEAVRRDLQQRFGAVCPFYRSGKEKRCLRRCMLHLMR
jgi:yersiniabactin nonribosomal peptide/polyketide synthase